MAEFQRIVVPSGQTSSVNGGTITNPNIYAGNGAAAEVQSGGALNVSGAEFIKNSAYQDKEPYCSGGAIYVSGGTLNTSNANFSRNFAPFGSILYNANGTVNISGGVFFSNYAGTKGGIINCSGTVNVSGATFTGNTTGLNGASLYNSGGSVVITDTKFFGNRAPSNGAALYNVGGTATIGSAMVSGCTFANNSCGAIFNAGTATISGATFTRNITASKGGAILNSKGTLNVTDGIFTGNRTLSGGAIFNTRSTTLSGATFSGNTATFGGAIYNTFFLSYGTGSGGMLDISGGVFTGNTATSNGGVIFNGGSVCVANVSSAVFSSNSCNNNGGAIYNDSGTVNLSGATFLSNRALNSGGAIYNNGGTVNLSGALFSGNTATQEGAAIYNNKGIVNFDGSATFTGNSSYLAVLQNTAGKISFNGLIDLQTAYDKWYNCGAIIGDKETYAVVNWDLTGGLKQYASINGFDYYDINGTFDEKGKPVGFFVNQTISVKAEGQETGEYVIATSSGMGSASSSQHKYNFILTNGSGKTVDISVNQTKQYGDDTYKLSVRNNSELVLTLYEKRIIAPGGTVTELTSGKTYTCAPIAVAGAALYVVEDGEVTGENVGFSDNMTLKEGVRKPNGGAVANNGTVTLTNADFTENVSAGNGGAIANFGTVTLTNADFTGNISVGNGGAIYGKEGTLELKGTANFTGNDASGSAGAIYNGGMMTINDVTFTDNVASVLGGAILSVNTLEVKGTAEFTGNTTGKNGGALYNNGTVSFAGAAKFVNNVGGTYGGALYNPVGGTVSFAGSSASFTGNRTGSEGGAVWNQGNITFNSKSDFSDNLTVSDGGAISNGGKMTFANEVTFERNIGLYGGAISNGRILTFTKGATFTDNKVIGSGNAGGAIENYGGTITFDDALFSGNSAMNGGAIYNENKYSGETGLITFASGATFSGNSATSGKGGAIYNAVGVINFAGTMDLATSTDSWYNAAGSTVNWDLTGGTEKYGSIDNFQYYTNENATVKQTITVSPTQEAGKYIIATGNMNGYADDTTGKYKFLLTGVTGTDVEISVDDTKIYTYSGKTYKLTVSDNGTASDLSDDKLLLTINPIEYTVSESINTVYDGTEQSITVTVTNPETGATVYYSIDGKETWTEGSSYSLTDVTEETVTVYFKIEADDYATTITDARTITIEKREIMLISSNATKAYDGEALKKEEVTAINVVDGEGFDYSNFASQTEVGSTRNTFDYEAKTGTKEENYKVTIVNGSLIVTETEAEEKKPEMVENDAVLIVSDTQKQEVVSFNVAGENATVQNDSDVNVSVGDLIASNTATVENNGEGTVSVLAIVGKDVEILNHHSGTVKVIDGFVASGNMTIKNDQVSNGVIILGGTTNTVGGALNIVNTTNKIINGGGSAATEDEVAAKITVTGSDDVTVTNEGHINMNILAVTSKISITNGASNTLIGDYTGKDVDVTNNAEGAVENVTLLAAGNAMTGGTVTLTGEDGSIFKGSNKITAAYNPVTQSTVEFVGTNTFTGTLSVNASFINIAESNVIKLQDVDAAFNSSGINGTGTFEISGTSKVTADNSNHAVLKEGVVLSSLVSKYATIEGNATLKDGAAITLIGEQTLASGKTVTVTGTDSELRFEKNKTLTNNGTINVSEGAWFVGTIGGTFSNGGILNVGVDGTVDVLTTTNTGTINLKGGVYTRSMTTNSGTLNWDLSEGNCTKIKWGILTNTQDGTLAITVNAADKIGDSYTLATDATEADGSFKLTGIGTETASITVGDEAVYNGFFYTLGLNTDNELVFTADRYANPKVEVSTEEKWFNANESITIEGTVLDYVGNGIKSVVISGSGLTPQTVDCTVTATATTNLYNWSGTFKSAETVKDGTVLTVTATDKSDPELTGTAEYTLKADGTGPVITITRNPQVESGTIQNSVTVTASAVDALSGFDHMTYSIDNGAAQNYTIGQELEFTENSKVVFTAYDKVGNVSTEELFITDLEAITITAASDSKIYDGTALTNSGYTFNEEALIVGDVLTVTVEGSITNVGEEVNKITSYTIMRGTENVTASYNITSVNGLLTIDPKRLTIDGTTVDDKVYDGTIDAVVHAGTLSGIVGDDEVTLNAEGHFNSADAGKRTVTALYTLTGAQAGNYEVIPAESFEAAIEKRSVILVSASDSKVFDGTPLVNHTVTVYGDGFAGDEGALYDVTGKQTKVGTSKNTFTYELVNGAKESNYVIAQLEGDLTVTPRVYVFTTKGDVNGNGVSDVMFQFTGGDQQIGYWLDGTDTWQSTGSAQPVTWDLISSSDMDANGKADAVMMGNVVVSDVKGAYIGYYKDGDTTVDGWNNIGYLGNAEDNNWTIKVGNMTGREGKNSIVWHSDNLGAVGVWINGTDTWVSLDGNFGEEWTLEGTGDFDGDGKDEALFANWYGELQTTGIGKSAAELATTGVGWEVATIGDFDGNGKDDVVLFHEESGLVAKLAGGTSFEVIGQMDADDWFICGSGDYNGDQQDDLLVRQYSTGMLGYYSSGDMNQWNEMGRGVDMKWTVIA